jgi:hypothetical protein
VIRKLQPSIVEGVLIDDANRIRWKAFLKLVALIILIILANYSVNWISDLIEFEYRPANEELVHNIIILSTIAYALLIAIPFVPGVEIGLTLLAMFGHEIVPLVYVSTISGLMISFLVGRLLSLKALILLFEDLHFYKASELISQIQPLKMEDRLAFLISGTSNRIVPFLLRHRYLALAIAINLPGNMLIGGGGGIALIAGASKLFSVHGFILTIVFAVSPIPLSILIFGQEILRT